MTDRVLSPVLSIYCMSFPIIHSVVIVYIRRGLYALTFNEFQDKEVILGHSGRSEASATCFGILSIFLNRLGVFVFLIWDHQKVTPGEMSVSKVDLGPLAKFG